MAFKALFSISTLLILNLTILKSAISLEVPHSLPSSYNFSKHNENIQFVSNDVSSTQVDNLMYSDSDDMKTLQFFDGLTEGLNFYGQWSTLDSLNLINFKSDNGYTYLTSYSHTTDLFPSSKLFLYIYDGQYVDSHNLVLSFDKFSSMLPLSQTYNKQNA